MAELFVCICDPLGIGLEVTYVLGRVSLLPLPFAPCDSAFREAWVSIGHSHGDGGSDLLLGQVSLLPLPVAPCDSAFREAWVSTGHSHGDGGSDLIRKMFTLLLPAPYTSPWYGPRSSW